jgi:hypothetical protein
MIFEERDYILHNHFSCTQGPRHQRGKSGYLKKYPWYCFLVKGKDSGCGDEDRINGKRFYKRSDI